MSRTATCLIILSVLVASAVAADPIPNGSFATRAAGWFDAKGLTCPQVCEKQKAVAEHEANTAPPVAASYVCKVRKAHEGPYLWLYGTQFGDRPACYTTDRDLKGEYSDIFYCLCVKPRGAARAAAAHEPGN